MKYFLNKRLLLIALLTLVLHCVSYAQAAMVSGNAIDGDNNEPIIGATVVIKGTTVGAVTDFDGNFSINVSAGQTLVFTYMGYKTIEMPVVSSKNRYDVKLYKDATDIEEVVVVGYGQQKKASAIGSIATTKGDDLLKAGNVTSVSEALQGQMPGVVAINTTSKPGADDANILIRGKSSLTNTSPLTLVDGIERSINDVDFNEIESISVLKDASATAVYGVKGANGVILLTTKRGSVQKARVNFSTNLGFKQPTVDYNYADYITSMKLYNEAAKNDLLWGNIIPDSEIDAWENAYATGNYGPYNDIFPEVDWFKETTKKFGFSQTYNVNVSGGSERMKYFVSLGYINDGDIYDTYESEEYNPKFNYQRYNWRTNFDYQLTKTTSLSANIAGSLGYQNQPGYRNDGGDKWLFNGILEAAANEYPIKYSDDQWGTGNRDGNIVSQLNEQGQRTFKTSQGMYDVAINQDLGFITKGLKVKAALSYTSASRHQSKILKGTALAGTADVSTSSSIVRYYRTYDYTKPIINADGTITYPLLTETRKPNNLAAEDQPVGASYDAYESSSRKLYYEVAINYARKFNEEHNVTALAVFNRQSVQSNTAKEIDWLKKEEDWVGRVTYNYKERYLTEVNAAYTGSEKFAPGKRFGFFPSFSLGWRPTEEPFMKNIKDKWLSSMKLRYSMGKVGSDNGARRFGYIQVFTSGGNAQFGQTSNVNYGPLYTEGTLADATSTWEIAVKQNFGIETTLFNKLNINLDLFKEKRSGILMSAANSTAPWIGATLPNLNIGETKNHGLELDVTWNQRINQDFSYFTRFNFGTSESRIVYADDPASKDDYLKQEGKPIGYQQRYIVSGNLASIDDIFNYTTIGISKVPKTQSNLVPGDFAYLDYNGDGMIDDNDKAVMENISYPLTTYSLGLGFNYKNVGVSATFYATTNVYMDKINFFNADFPNGVVKAQPDGMDRWTYANADNGEIERPSTHVSSLYNTLFNAGSNDYVYSNHSYLRLKNLEVNYVLPKAWTNKLQISRCQLYVNATNLFTISNNDKRRDPETASHSVYPIVKRYNFGARVTFN